MDALSCAARLGDDAEHGIVLETLGERESGTAHLDEAVAAFRLALEVFTEAEADYYANICRNNRDKALAILAERTK